MEQVPSLSPPFPPSISYFPSLCPPFPTHFPALLICSKVYGVDCRPIKQNYGLPEQVKSGVILHGKVGDAKYFSS